MEKVFNDNFKVAILSDGKNDVLRCFSYGKLILQRHYVNRVCWDAVTVCDLNYYSQTTRRHQGIARALDSYFTAHDGNSEEMRAMVARSRSLRDLVWHFGYISIKK